MYTAMWKVAQVLLAALLSTAAIVGCNDADLGNDEADDDTAPSQERRKQAIAEARNVLVAASERCGANAESDDWDTSDDVARDLCFEQSRTEVLESFAACIKRRTTECSTVGDDSVAEDCYQEASTAFDSEPNYAPVKENCRVREECLGSDACHDDALRGLLPEAVDAIYTCIKDSGVLTMENSACEDSQDGMTYHPPPPEAKTAQECPQKVFPGCFDR